MSRILVTYFTISGNTRTAAEKLAAVTGADLFEIRPEVAYTEPDLDWNDVTARSTVEMHDLDARPTLAEGKPDMDKYDVIFIGFPIWWGREPSIVDSFIDSLDLAGKRVISYCTHGGDGFENKAQIEKLVPGVEGHKEIYRETTEDELKAWIKALGL